MKQTFDFKSLVPIAALSLGVAGFLPGLLAAEAGKALYENNFEKAAVGSVPDDFLVLDGGFAVKQEDGNRFLELPGAPVDSFGVLFGPTEKEGVLVSARIRSTARKRRAPAFGVGLGGAGGYRLQISPAKAEIEIYKGDELKTKAPYQWESGKWTELRLQLRKVSGAWKVEGKAWTQGAAEPKAWLLSFDAAEEPTAGRAAIWGQPYAGTPIQFDDLAVAEASARP